MSSVYFAIEFGSMEKMHLSFFFKVSKAQVVYFMLKCLFVWCVQCARLTKLLNVANKSAKYHLLSHFYNLVYNIYHRSTGLRAFFS